MVSSGNVVALGGLSRARPRLSPQESAVVLDGCRSLALERIGGALAGMLDRVERELGELAGKAADADSQGVFLDARDQARRRRADIEASFRRHFLDLFDRKAGRRHGAPPPRLELSLVADEDLEESLAMEEMARKLRVECDEELFVLGERMGYLLDRESLEDDANPVSPGTVLTALRNACGDVAEASRVRLALLRRLEHHAERELRAIYADLNAHLAERQILPELRPATRRAAPAAAASAPQPVAAAPAAEAPAADLFATLAQLLGAAAGAVSASAPAAGAPAAPMPLPEAGALLAELTRLHRALPAAQAEPGENLVRGLKSGPHAAQLSTVDAMTIDIVAMLFDYVYEDRHIPASVKALLGRLQIPTLKAALLDKAFFSSKSHPARRLIDLLAQVSLGLDDGNARTGGTLALVEEVVQRVLDDFETDLAVFESLVAKVEAFAEERDRHEAEMVERTAQLVEARERDEIARAVAEAEVASRLAARGWVPPPVREMLLEHWSRALASAQLAEGEGGPAWQALAATMDDLLWSVEPKVSPEERKRLVARLPRMLASLQEGMRRAAMPQAETDRFLGVLVDCHAAAVKAGLRGLAAVPDPAPAPDPAEEPKIQRSLVPAGDLQVEEIRLRVPRGAPVRNVFTRTGIWTNLQRGTWVEFARETGSGTRARLTWISPNKAVYLFTNPLSGAIAVSISPEALAEQMRRGEARLLDDAPLVARAVDSMIATLRRAPG